MKTYLMPLAVLATVVSLSSCVKSPSSPDGDKPANTFPEIKVPANFDWKTSKSVTTNFKSPNHTAVVYLSLIGESESFASFYVGNAADQVTFSVPNTTSEIEVQYQKVGGLSVATKLNIVNGVVQYTVPNDSEAVMASATQNMAANANDKPYVVMMPAKGMGTLMFEDLWPYYGDYDFNDFVINYRIQLNFQNANKVKQMTVTLRVSAVGGALPFEVFMQLDKVNGGEVDYATAITYKNTVGTPSVVCLNNANSNHDPAVLAFKGIKENINRPAGGSFLNTSKGYEIPQSKMVEVMFYMDFRNAIPIADLDIKNINFFVAQAGQGSSSLKEVHLGGFDPSFMGKSLYEELKSTSNVTNKSTNFYMSNTNLVWAINIPEVIPHAYEGKKFLEAYPDFEKWAKSGGIQNNDWYAPENRNEDLLVK